MSLAGFEFTFPESERPQTQALDHAATGIDHLFGLILFKHQIVTICPIASLEIRISSPKIWFKYN